MNILEKWRAKGLLDGIESNFVAAVVAALLENQEISHINYTEIATKLFDVQPLGVPYIDLIIHIPRNEEKDYFMEGLQG
jgi:hypothetical protein